MYPGPDDKSFANGHRMNQSLTLKNSFFSKNSSKADQVYILHMDSAHIGRSRYLHYKKDEGALGLLFMIIDYLF